jgi:hypothetical protein
MSEADTHRVEVNGRLVRVHVTRPGESPDGGAPWAILACERPATTVEVSKLLPVLGESLAAAGCALIRYDVEAASADESLTGEDLVSEVLAVLKRLNADDAIDRDRCGLLGIGPGAIIAAATAVRIDWIRQVCLLNPTVPEDLVTRRSKNNGQSSLLSTSRWSSEFVKSLVELDPAAALGGFAGSVLVLQGAGDRLITSACAHPYLDARDVDGRPTTHELIALGDERMNSEELIGVYVHRLLQFFEQLKLRESTEITG